ncbi:MAG: hypothetical protein JOZ08_05805 [Verrucomicrobia bacterium]|nr:hypothetical protein [Verrucomicrobiota bacterium]
MDLRLYRLPIFLLLTFAGQTTLLAAERVMGLEMQTKMEWPAFSVLQLPDCWFLYRCEQSKRRALFHRDFVDPEHTMRFQVELIKLPATGSLAGALGQRFRHDQAVVIDYREERTTRSGQAAIRYACELQDLKLSRKFKKAIITRERGLTIIHPFLANTIIHIAFSETAPEGELHEAAFSQADNIMNRVALEAQ